MSLLGDAFSALVAATLGRRKRAPRTITRFVTPLDGLGFDPRSDPAQIAKMREMLHDPARCAFECRTPIVLAGSRSATFSGDDTLPTDEPFALLDLHTGAIWETVKVPG